MATKRKAVHARIIRGDHAYMACTPDLRVTGYTSIKLTGVPAQVTCEACKRYLDCPQAWGD